MQHSPELSSLISDFTAQLQAHVDQLVAARQAQSLDDLRTSLLSAPVQALPVARPRRVVVRTVSVAAPATVPPSSAPLGKVPE